MRIKRCICDNAQNTKKAKVSIKVGNSNEFIKDFVMRTFVYLSAYFAGKMFVSLNILADVRGL